MMAPRGVNVQQAGALPMASQQQQQQGATTPPGPPGPPGAPAPPPAPLAANYPVPQVSAPQPQQQRQVCAGAAFDTRCSPLSHSKSLTCIGSRQWLMCLPL